jgi:hypothetical protein
VKDVDRIDADEIKKVAKGLVDGRIFTALDCPPDMIGMVFMPLGLGGLGDYDIDQIGCVYEWLDKAGERGINGFPMFMSCKVIHKDDWDAVLDRARKVAAAIEEALK